MNNITKESFETTITALLKANPNNSNKGKEMKEWFMQSFSVKATVSNVKEDKQIGNRITEQFKHKATIVVFVCNEDVNADNLITRAIAQRYPALNSFIVVVAKDDGSFGYDKIYSKTQDNFTNWAVLNLGVSVEPLVNNSSSNIGEEVPHQQIFYGAPGTGKSHEVKKRTGELFDNGEEKDLPNVFRTTFHPDTDYASFVGCYKPSMRKTGKKHQVDGIDVDDEEIIYEFVPQIFTDAYVYAYKNPKEPTYLVIEEINRGNCAQIFGDLFQLLDRKNGVSEYRIKADKDLAKFLNEEFGKDEDGIKDGKLCLPANLFILATMNTSDQSLFPMDSAFKRRWEWKYIKITNGYKEQENGEFEVDADGKKIPLNWKIETNGEDWYGFIQQINRIISNMTSSADKQLGYFFCHANEDKIIKTETFVSKVIFYLWNDVFKDYGFDDESLFKYKTEEGKEEDLTFPDFYDEEGNVMPDVVKQFIEHVMAWKGDDKKDNN
jgi:hypothetical protein